MKKNDTMGYVVYALMLVIALCVAFLYLGGANGVMGKLTEPPMGNNYLFVFVVVIGAILLNAILIELGHLLGAKMGRYTIDSWVCLGLGAKRQKNGKMKFCFSDFDGLTGWTVIVPKDIKKSNPRHFIYMPLFFFLLEVIGCVTLIAVGAQGQLSLQILGVLILTVGGMIYLYDIFPSALDGANDGYLMTILNSQVNVEAYNEILLAKAKAARGEKADTTHLYEEVTDFTYTINSMALYEALGKGDFEKALTINEYTINSKKTISNNLYEEAVCQKVALYFLSKSLEEAKKFFIDLPLEDKKHMAALNSVISVRAYVLASGLAEESLFETQAALDKADKFVKKLPENQKTVEGKLVWDCLGKVKAAHPDWDLSDYDYLKDDDAPKAEEEPVKAEEAKPAEEEKPSEAPAEEKKPDDSDPH